MAKKGDLLSVAALQNRELILGEIGNVLARAIRNDRWHEDDLAVNRDRRRLSGLALSCRLREGARRDAQEYTQKSEGLNRPSKVQVHVWKPPTNGDCGTAMRFSHVSPSCFEINSCGHLLLVNTVTGSDPHVAFLVCYDLRERSVSRITRSSDDICSIGAACSPKRADWSSSVN